jgi:GTPase SAR1 family protein
MMFDEYDIFGIGKQTTGGSAPTNHTIKAIVIGGKNVGKTTIASAFSSFESFKGSSGCNSGKSHVPTFQSTFVADRFNKTLPMGTVLSTLHETRRPAANNPRARRTDIVNVVMWDTAGYERYDSIPPSFLMNGSQVVILCFSLDDVSSVDKIPELIECCKKSNVDDDCVFFILGTKMDVHGLYNGAIKHAYEKLKNNDKTGPFASSLSKIGLLTGFNGAIDESYFENHDYYDCSKRPFFKEAKNNLLRSQRGVIDLNGRQTSDLSSDGESFVMVDFSNESNSIADGGDKKTRRKRRATKEVLFAYTSIFCDGPVLHNPVYCLLYAIAVYIERKTQYHAHDGGSVLSTILTSTMSTSIAAKQPIVLLEKPSPVRQRTKEGVIKTNDKVSIDNADDDDARETTINYCCGS